MRELLPTTGAVSLRANFAKCAVDLSLEHHSALVRVTEAGEYGTAGALLRPILEAATAAFWFVYAATCDEIRALPTTAIDNPRDDVPGLANMFKVLIPIFPQIQVMADGLRPGGSVKWLHKYTHGGTPQLTRRGALGWSEREVILTLIRADLFSTLATSVETVIAPSVPLSASVFGARDELATEYHTYFGGGPIPPQPHGLPVAPLLADGCGLPFG
jgi:hypothetical protein